jgi:hypothetical protein
MEQKSSGLAHGCRGLAAQFGLEQYEAAFRDNSVDAEILPRLTGRT